MVSKHGFLVANSDVDMFQPFGQARDAAGD
jgi:hypothetical protein